MADQTVPICVSSEKPIKLAKWKVKQGAFVSQGQILFLYSDSAGENKELKKFKATHAGTVYVLKVAEGDILQPGSCVAELAACRHPTVMKEMCAECGADLRADNQRNKDYALVPMVHSVPELKVSEELAKKLGREDAERLLKDRKLVLLVDLDQTLVHTTNENVPANLKDVLHFFLRSPGCVGHWCHTRLRPGTTKFLEAASTFYELHVCTFGARQYAHAVAELLDPEKKFFSHRILSRDECFDPRTKSANLKALFPCGDNMVCIIDDREDVWRHASNLIHVKPYIFFQNTGDINAPPPLDEKTKLIGKNGSNIPTGNEMPILDEPDLESKCENTDKTSKDTKKTSEVPEKVSKETEKGSKDLEKVFKDLEKVSKEPEKVFNDLEKGPKDPEKVSKAIEKSPKETEKGSKDNEKSKETEGSNGKISPKDIESQPKVATPEEKEVIAESGDKEHAEMKWVETADGQLEVDDPDDYLIYLEDILTRIHKCFYELYDKSNRIGDLKAIIPEVKSQVLAGTSLVFSGLVPTHQRLQTSKAYSVARSLGAEVTQDFNESTTHLVAVRSGTAKVNASRRLAEGKEKLAVVTPEWLWACAERWERVDERLFPLQRGGQQITARRPPAHCSSPPPAPPVPLPVAALRKRTPSGRFMDTLNPLLSFSSDDIADMDREVEDIFNESDESSTDEENPREDRLIAVENEDSSQERLRRDLGDSDSDTNLGDDDSRPPKRPRKSSPPSDEEPPDDDDSSWNLMGAALEREFLAQD